MGVAVLMSRLPGRARESEGGGRGCRRQTRETGREGAGSPSEGCSRVSSVSRKVTAADAA